MRYSKNALFPKALALAVLAGSAAAQTQIGMIANAGGWSVQQFGSTVCNLGDLDGDGFVELAVAAPTDTYSFVNIYSSHGGALLRQHLGLQQYEKLGRAIAKLGDVDADGVSDYAIGAAGFDVSSPAPLGDAGRVTIFSGASGAVLRQIEGTQANQEFGYSIDATGDVDGDLQPDLIVGSFWSGAWVYSSTGSLIHALPAPNTADRYGWSVAGLGDLNGDGRGEFAIAAPQFQIGTGYVKVYNGYDKSLRYTLTGPTNNSWFGQCIRGVSDVDADGRRELAVGAPAFNAGSGGEGLVRVFSGVTGSLIRGINGQLNNENFGSAIDSGGDLNSDGQADMIVGAPNTRNLLNTGAGSARAFSGADGSQLFDVRGTAYNAHLGQAVALLEDIDGDSRFDFVAGATEEVAGGAAILFSGACYPPEAYCVAKVNSQGCIPTVSSTGTPSLFVTDNFHVLASNVLNQKSGLMLVGITPHSAPFNGGTLCVYQIMRRISAHSSGGNPLPPDCSGNYDVFFTQVNLQAMSVVVGQMLYVQFWSRDSGFAAPNNVGLTDALRFTICD